MDYKRTVVPYQHGVIDIQTIELDAAQRAYIARGNHIKRTAAMHILERSVFEEGGYCPPQHVYMNLTPEAAAELSAVFARVSRELRGVEE